MPDLTGQTNGRSTAGGNTEMWRLREVRLHSGVLGLGLILLLATFPVLTATAIAAPAPSPQIHSTPGKGSWGQVGSSLSAKHWHSHPGEFVKPLDNAAGRSYTQLQSTNWAGQIDFANTSSNFSGVSGDWMVPPVAPSTSSEYSGSWLGIDGATNEDLIQTGTASDSGPGGGYYAWAELLPNEPVVI